MLALLLVEVPASIPCGNCFEGLFQNELFKIEKLCTYIIRSSKGT